MQPKYVFSVHRAFRLLSIANIVSESLLAIKEGIHIAFTEGGWVGLGWVGFFAVFASCFFPNIQVPVPSVGDRGVDLVSLWQGGILAKGSCWRSSGSLFWILDLIERAYLCLPGSTTALPLHKPMHQVQLLTDYRSHIGHAPPSSSGSRKQEKGQGVI